MKIKKQHKIGIVLGLLVIAFAFLFKGTPYFPLVVGLGIIIGVSSFVFSTVLEARVSLEKEEMFLEFARNLVESVKMGSSISRSIIILKDRDYGELSPYVRKLANQISLGIPLSISMQNFSKGVGNKKISRAIILIRQAEKAGGNIGEILESVAEAVSMADKLKKERKAAISSLMVQGYIIFIVFLIIVLLMQFQILPMVSGISQMATSVESSVGEETRIGQTIETKEMANAFLNLLLVQGFFSGLIIGKLAEGNVKKGIKHSFILMLIAFLVSTGANVAFG